MSLTLYKDDLPDSLAFSGSIAIDTETLGLNLRRDRLCLVQISGTDGDAHLVQISQKPNKAPNLCRILADDSIEKIFHFARFDMATLQYYLGVMPTPIFCTKIASKIARTYTDRHGLREVTRALLQTDISKEQQSSDWSAENLSAEQLKYAASDVLHLHGVRDKLIEMLERNNRLDLAQACFACLPTCCRLDIAGWTMEDIFSH